MIRPAVTQDLTTIRQLVDAAYQHWFARTGRVPGPLRDDYAQRLADAQLWVLEIDGEIVGEAPSHHDAAQWFVEQDVARCQRACVLTREAPLVILDGDPFKGLWYNCIFSADGWPSVEASAVLYREHVRHGTLAFPDLYVVLAASEAQLRQRRAGDATRRRHSFEKHLALVKPQRRYFTAMHDAAPGRVLFLDSTSQDTLPRAVNAAVTARLLR